MGEVFQLLFFAAIVGLVYVAGFWHGYIKAGATVINIVTGELKRIRITTPTGAHDEH
jgi:hypothetical protein